VTIRSASEQERLLFAFVASVFWVPVGQSRHSTKTTTTHESRGTGRYSLECMTHDLLNVCRTSVSVRRMYRDDGWSKNDN
jgi:hypothetical protein